MRWWLGILVLIGLGVEVRAGDVDAAGVEWFEKKVRPVLVERCYKCHSATAEKLKGELLLDSADGIKKGGVSEMPAVVGGDVADSLLLKAVRWELDDLRMPPKEKLGEQQIKDLEEWVKMGAPMPAGEKGVGAKSEKMTLEEGRSFWSFVPPVEPSVPKVEGGRNEVDAFVLEKLGEKGLGLAPEADRRTLIRRAAYDLTGLPPSAEEVAAFERDAAPDAYEKLIERLLASPRYGERWGRHWLDVARYADTKGYVFEEERRFGFAWTYRDWVIRSMNEDLPYDQFLVQQIAADRLELKGDNKPLAALGFLTLGRRFINNQHDIIDDRIDVVTRGTMGLTVACARCHDHKYDPIPTADYYSLYGVFASSREPGELPLIEEEQGEKSAERKAFDAELAKRREARDGWVRDRIAEIVKAKGITTVPASVEEGKKLFDGADHQKLRQLDKAIDELIVSHAGSPARAMAMEDVEQPVTPKVFKRGNPGNLGEEVPRRFLEVLTKGERKGFADGSGRLELARAIASKENPLTARVMVNRVWGWHFGQGLVRTVSDFGTRGDRPTHPELLDWLAVKFSTEDGWSAKKLHRRIMLSGAYRQSSQLSVPSSRLKRGEELDPENRLLWHFPARRLGLEELRDSLLVAAGGLDLAVGGRSVDILARPFVGRRTVYGFVDRQNLPGLFRTFDFASPDGHVGRRPETSVPQQALFMINSPFVVEQARKVAARSSVAGEKDANKRVGAMYRAVLGRDPSEEELKLAIGFVAGEEKLREEASQERDAVAEVWEYGYGEYDEAGGRMKAFARMPHFAKSSGWQGGNTLPDAKLGWALLTAGGGHAGNDLRHAVVRRWVAERDCTVSVEGTLSHTQAQGDGVRGRLIAGAAGTVGTWVVHNREVGTSVSAVKLKKGEAVEFVVDCGPRGDVGWDQFGWVVRVTKVATEGAAAGDDAGRVWDSKEGFKGPKENREGMNVWEKLAQVLLQSNEFAFVD